MIDPEFDSLEPAIDPSHKISFLLDWELTMKCNLDCSYCVKGLYGGHDNTIKHPSKQDCFDTIDFMFEYVSLYMQHKIPSLRMVILNVYGGESLHHPDIVEILKEVQKRYREKFRLKFSLTVTTTTNAIVPTKKLYDIIPLIDEFTVSYHSENTDKQKKIFKNNLITLKQANKRLKCVVLMHPKSDLFQDTTQMISWLSENSIQMLPRQLDHAPTQTQFNYNQDQVTWFKQLYQTKSYKKDVVFDPKKVEEKFDLADTGRACCGGRSFCTDQNHRSRQFFVTNKFPDWYCSVDQFFLYIKQVNGEIYVNKDCKMNFDGKVGPIGYLQDAQDLLIKTAKHLTQESRPIIRCKKSRCLCGLCAPKAKTLDKFQQIMAKFQA